MNIGINAYEAVVQRFGFNSDGLPNRVGSSEFCYQLLESLSKVDTENKYSIYLPVAPSRDMPKEDVSWKYEVFKSKKLWTLFGLSKKLFADSQKLDVFFNPTHYLPITTGTKTVISVLDVSYLRFPQLFTKKDLYMLKVWGKFSIRRAHKIITISEASKSDIIKAYRVPKSKVEVVYPGLKFIKSRSNLDMEKYGLKGDYILFVGTLQPRKNIVKLIEAFSQLKSKDLTLVIIGRKGWMYEEILSAPKKYGLNDRVKFLHDVPDEDLPGFYKNSLMFVLPSLYEGFGLPVLEAMQYETPVITSNVSSLPEAGGDAALYVDPESVEDITAKMQKLIDEPDLRKEMIAKGKKQAAKFSWDKAAKETLSVLEEVVNG